ncbi:hypothetical protein LB543_16465 [Mesorhizobium sp. ESP7-2]|uniref:hypothetical protein n=1 Tax=unclassified Mesorhizobium TaxID=325217 RepID=UPI001CC9AD05|nr:MULTISPECIES: hypothetical protein [unclassified Mesorhizobium]MBZ9672037.1 hypothetical protein [Mesorhizobium sp. ES1-3]MBZ9708319.1 hypothetical protein [Mesorhizobium sp. ESP7-2]
MKRILNWLSTARAAQAALGLLIVIAIRSILEFFRVGGASGGPVGDGQLFYVEGALAASIAALAVLVLHAFGRHRWATMLTAAVIVALLAWKITATS